MTPGPSPALVADYLIFFRGAERTFAQMAECWPEAPIYTIAYRSGATAGRFDGRVVRTSFLQRLGLTRHWYRWALPMLPRAAESLDVSGHDVVVSSSFGFAHGVRPREGAVHVCYCHSPFRQAWHEYDRAVAGTPRLARGFAARSLSRMRAWDLEASRRVTSYIANSEITRGRIAELYGRDAAVLHPPVEVARFRPGSPQDYFLFVGELVAHKRVDVALEAARLAGRRMVVVGNGPELRRLRTRFGEVATFMGRIGDEELASVYAGALALVIPNVEEFGIAGVEAQAAGRPVLALGQGGARETVVEGETGVLIEGAGPDAFAEAMRAVDFTRFDQAAARRNAERFAPELFRSRLRELVERAAAG
ncbi:MAG TPA: glycosyltransferase [Solirubrobacterales bacterium]|nr:glycosyltransferase [Solirubrobacterales bacterium]